MMKWAVYSAAYPSISPPVVRTIMVMTILHRIPVFVVRTLVTVRLSLARSTLNEGPSLDSGDTVTSTTSHCDP
jgi:hypothetical protein